ncbi:MAG: hypothetical protein EA388_04125 [Nitriliruptor sp.]|nr:MAG: hypothetical protein EA388_04125 [Nitriliruptor sp.]
MSDFRRAGQFVLGVLSLFLAVSFAVQPVEQKVIEYPWSAATDGPSVPLILTERTPHLFELTFPCSTALAGEGVLFASSRDPESVPALTVAATPRSITVELPETGEAGRRALDLPALDDGSCETVRVHYERDIGRLSVETESDRAVLNDLDDDAFVLTGLHWSGPPAQVSATVVTEPRAEVRNTTAQRLTLLVIFLLAGVSITWSVLERRSTRSNRERPACRPLDRWDWAMLGTTTVVMLVDFFRIDDGGILARARFQATSIFTSNLSTMFEGRALPQRAVYEYLLGSSVGWSETIVVLRLPSLVAAFGSWLLFRRYILPKLASDPSSPAVVASTWGVHAVFVVAWFATLRPEPFLVLLSVGVMAVIAAWPTQVRAWPYILVIGLVGLAVSTHITGLVTAALGIGILPRTVREVGSQPARVLQGWAWGVVAALLALVVGGNFGFVYESATRFRAGTTHGRGILDSMTYVTSVSTGTPPMIVSMLVTVVGFAVLLFAIALPRPQGGDVATRWLLIGTALAPVGLLVTPSKWIWHLAMLLPVALVGMAIMVATIGRRPRGAWVSGIAAVAGGLTIAGALSSGRFDRTPGAGFRDLALRNVRPNAWADRLPLLVGEGTQFWLWIGIFLLVIGSSSLVVRYRQAHLGAAATTVSILLVCGIASTMQLAVPIMDAVRAEDGDWTFVRQSIGGVVSKDLACGVAAATPELVEWIERNPEHGADVREGRMTGPRVAGILLPCHRQIGQVDGVWERPDLVLQELTIGQRRLEDEFAFEEVACNPTPREPSDGFCFLAVTPSVEAIQPRRIDWRTRRP